VAVPACRAGLSATMPGPAWAVLATLARAGSSCAAGDGVVGAAVDDTVVAVVVVVAEVAVVDGAAVGSTGAASGHPGPRTRSSTSLPSICTFCTATSPGLHLKCKGSVPTAACAAEASCNAAIITREARAMSVREGGRQHAVTSLAEAQA